MKASSWLTSMNVFLVCTSKVEGDLSFENKKCYNEANTLCVGVVIENLEDHLQDMYIHHKVSKESWDALCAD